jgi:protein gp37
MGFSSAIEWTESTWNPWRGCTKISPGCASCYMYRGQARFGRDPSVVIRAQPHTFNAPIRWQRTAVGRGLVFTCSWSDWFHPNADAWREEAWNIIRFCPGLTFQILTKRPELIRDRLPKDWGPNGYPNVWLGVSLENSRFFWRIEALLEANARLRFISAEPLLNRVDLKAYLATKNIGWVIVGGESGGRPKHPPRPMKLEWVQLVRDQCIEAGVPFFFKQWGGRKPGGPAILDGQIWREVPALATDSGIPVGT